MVSRQKQCHPRNITPRAMSLQKLHHPRSSVTPGAASPRLCVTPVTVHPRNRVTCGATSLQKHPYLGVKTTHSTPEVEAGRPWGPSACSGTWEWVSSDCVQAQPPAPDPGPLPSPWTPDSLHSRVKQVELSPALIAGTDAGVLPQPLHGHGVALLEFGHLVGVLAHDHAGVVLGRDGRGGSEQPDRAGRVWGCPPGVSAPLARVCRPQGQQGRW